MSSAKHLDGADDSPPLQNAWSLFYHLPHDKKWDLPSYKIIMDDIDTTEKLIAINETMPEDIVKTCMLFMMRKNIPPLWEDPKNKNGGCFSYKISNKQVYLVWRHLVYILAGETLFKNNSGENIMANGISISPKKNFCIIKIWFPDCLQQNPNVVFDIPNLQKEGCLFTAFETKFT